MEPDCIEAEYNMALCYFKLNRSEKIIEIFDRIASSDQCSDEMLISFGKMSIEMKTFEKAIEYFTECKRISKIHEQECVEYIIVLNILLRNYKLAETIFKDNVACYFLDLNF